MLEVQDYTRSLERSRQALARTVEPTVFTMDGREWDLLPGVFAPIHSPTTGFSLELLGLSGPLRAPRSGSMLEVGCGTGVTAVLSALAGCDRVVAADISPAAVRNAALNAARHGLGERLRSVQSDLFDGLDPQERFDTVFWHSNYVLAPEGYQYQSMHERAYVDPGYATHRRFLLEAPLRLTPEGSAILHFSGRGDLEALRRIAAEVGRELRVLRREVFDEGGLAVAHMLIEVTAPRP